MLGINGSGEVRYLCTSVLGANMFNTSKAVTSYTSPKARQLNASNRKLWVTPCIHNEVLKESLDGLI